MVKAHVERQAVIREVVPHLVGRTPTNILPKIGTDDLDDLARKADGEEEDPCPDHVANGAISLSSVDEEPKDLRIREVQSDPDGHTEAESKYTTLVGPEIPCEKREIVSKRDTLVAGDWFVLSGRAIRADLLPPA